MLESGIDRIISQVVDPKINHTFRPQVEKAVHEFLATLNHKEEAGPSTAPSEEKMDASVAVQGIQPLALVVYYQKFLFSLRRGALTRFVASREPLVSLLAS